MSTRIARFEAIPARVPFRREFVIGRGAVGTAGGAGNHVFVRLETEDGHVGWGETRALPSWSYETVESITAAVQHYLGPLLIGHSPFALNAIHRAMYETLTPSVSNGQPFAKSAIDIALHDLMGQIAGVPVHALLGGKVRDAVDLTFALSIAEPAEMAEAAASYPSVGCFKIKVAGDPARDEDRIRRIAAAAPETTLWLDANQAYAPALALQLLERVADMERIFCVEQPVKSVDWYGMRQVRERSRLPVAIDEGCFSAYDVVRMRELGCADMVVLKVCKSAGLRECLKSASAAEALGLGLLGSGLTESGIGLAASVHLFATIDTLLPPELNGVQFLESMLVDGLEVSGATVTVPDGPGLGIRVDEAAIRGLTR
jgi:muconate cycloisomerase